MATPKEELKRFKENQPDDSSDEEISRELAFHVMIQRSLSDSDTGRTILNADMNRRICLWRR